MGNGNNAGNGEERDFKDPVSWLLGRQLLAGLKWIAAYAFFGERLNPKDWMSTRPINIPPSGGNEFWFDYIADTGDGSRATYSIACLAMSDVWLADDEKAGPEAVAAKPREGFGKLLPRGAFLFVGGDWAYHIADVASLRERFQTPFNWAFDDLSQTVQVERRPIFGIPANHDYYDGLHGFNRQLIEPIGGERTCPADDAAESQPRLGLKGFERRQDASYVALNLPFGWKLWGLDSQEGKIDKRQQAFFISTFSPGSLEDERLFDPAYFSTLQGEVPDKLIVATPEPSTVFGRWAKDDSALAQTFQSLGLVPSFLESAGGQLPPGKCRLDISGDIHHYERYWGKRTETGGADAYASVVAGGGGAFLHPSHTDCGEVKAEARYPSKRQSHCCITQRLLNPFNIFQGGYVWLAGAILAALSYFALTVPESTWSLFHVFPDTLRPAQHLGDGHLLTRIQSALTTSTPVSPISGFIPDLAYALLWVGFLIYWLVRRMPGVFHLEGKDGRSEAFIALSRDRIQWKKRVIGFVWPVLAAASPLGLLVFLNRDGAPGPFAASLLIALFAIAAILLLSLNSRYGEMLIDRSRYRGEQPWDLVPFWVFGVLAAVSSGYGFLRYGFHPASIMTFDMMMALLWFLGSIGLIALAALAGGQFHDSRGKLGFGLLGVWHALMQLAVPVVLTMRGSFLSMAGITLAAYGATWIAGWAVTGPLAGKDEALTEQKRTGFILLAAWVVLGTGILWAGASADPAPVGYGRLLAAFVLGLAFSCIWFGWYLAVALAFNGHNNEAGGGARVQSYRHLVRFRLTPDELTGYVIGIDEPTDRPPAAETRYRLVDVFKVKVPKGEN